MPFLVKVGEVLADPGADLIFLFTFVKSISKTPGISLLFFVFCLLLFLFCSNNLLLIYNVWITISLFLCMKISPAAQSVLIQSAVLHFDKKFTVAKYTPSQFRMKVLRTRQNKVHFY